MLGVGVTAVKRYCAAVMDRALASFNAAGIRGFSSLPALSSWGGSRYGRDTPRHGTGFFLAQRVHTALGKRVIASGPLKTSSIAQPIWTSE
jgi:hypothetical protein